jgi:hypothetical protein
MLSGRKLVNIKNTNASIIAMKSKTFNGNVTLCVLPSFHLVLEEIGYYLVSDSKQVAERVIANRLKDTGSEPSSDIPPMVVLSRNKWHAVVAKS